MYLQSWDDFAKAAEQLYQNEPDRCRVALKYRHSDGILKVKVTDDVVCLQFKTEDRQDLKKIEKLIALLMRHMTTKDQL